MVPAISSVRPSSIEAPESFVNLEVGIPHGRSLSGWISYAQKIEGSQISRWERRESARSECRKISEIASRIFTEFGDQLKSVKILHISSRGAPAPVVTRIVSSLSNALLNLSRSMVEDEDEFRPSTPPPATMSDPAASAEFRINGLLVTPLRDPSMRLRAAIAGDSDYEYLPPGYQFATPPRPLQLDPAEGAAGLFLPQVALPAQLGEMYHPPVEGASSFIGRLFDDSDGPGASSPR